MTTVPRRQIFIILVHLYATGFQSRVLVHRRSSLPAHPSSPLPGPTNYAVALASNRIRIEKDATTSTLTNPHVVVACLLISKTKKNLVLALEL